MSRGLVALSLALAFLAAGCATPATAPAPTRAADFKASEIRQPALFVHVAVGNADWSERERASLPGDYEGALLETINARAIVLKDFRTADGRAQIDARSAIVRAREVGADHAIVVSARAGHEVVTVCEQTRRPLRATATVWKQDIEVFRVTDGAVRLRLVDSPATTVTDVKIECDRPREVERRSMRQTVAAAAEALVTRVFGP